MLAFSWKRPSAWLPVAMSLVALALVFGHIAVYGAAREADEGTTAHLFQLLMAGQFPVVVFFLLKWAPKYRSQAAAVIGVQIAAALVALAPVWYYKL